MLEFQNNRPWADTFFGSPWGQNIIWIFSNLRVVYFLEKYDELSELVAFAQNWGILQTRMDQRGNHMKMNFDYFQMQKWMVQKWGHLSSFHVSFLNYGP